MKRGLLIKHTPGKVYPYVLESTVEQESTEQKAEAYFTEEQQGTTLWYSLTENNSDNQTCHKRLRDIKVLCILYALKRCFYKVNVFR